MNEIEKPLVVIYTDGACSGNPGPGGWGALIKYGQTKKEIFGSEANTTNNRMEIMAAIEALSTLKKSCKVELFTDSKYLQQGINSWIHSWIKNNWLKSDRQPVKNVDLWKKLYDQLDKHDIVWKWVKGHSENIGNQIADQLAVKGKEEANKIALNINF